MKAANFAVFIVFVTAAPATAQVADARFVNDAALTVGSFTLSSPCSSCSPGMSKFDAASVGKSVQCGPGDHTGVQIDTTISAYVDPNTVTLASASPATASGWRCQWGTDNTASLTSLLRSGGKVGNGCFLARYIDLTGVTGLVASGSGNPVNDWSKMCSSGTEGTAIIPMGGHTLFMDATGAVGTTIRDMQLGSDPLSPVVGGLGIALANSNTITSTKIKIENVFIEGNFYVPFWNYGVAAVVVRGADFITHMPNWLGTMISRDNPYGFSSEHTTMATGYYAPGVFMDDVEMHAYQPGGGATPGSALRMRGVADFMCIHCGIDAPASGGVIVAENAADGTPNGRATFISATMYTEAGPAPVHCLNSSGSFGPVMLLNSTCAASGSAYVGMTPAFSAP